MGMTLFPSMPINGSGIAGYKFKKLEKTGISLGSERSSRRVCGWSSLIGYDPSNVNMLGDTQAQL